MGNEGLVARVSGSRATNVTITVNDIAFRFSRHENSRKNAMLKRSPKTTIWGRVRHPAISASHARVGRRLWAKSTARRTKQMLMT
jgi:hypothetical protein